MKVVWNLTKNKAIPLSNICCFEINTIDKWCEQSRNEWNGGRYYVTARYTIVYGDSEIVFTSDDKEECVKFIEGI